MSTILTEGKEHLQKKLIESNTTAKFNTLQSPSAASQAKRLPISSKTDSKPIATTSKKSTINNTQLKQNSQKAVVPKMASAAQLGVTGLRQSVQYNTTNMFANNSSEQKAKDGVSKKVGNYMFVKTPSKA